MATVRLDAFASELKAMVEGPLTGDQHRLAFARYAGQVRDEEIAKQTARGGAAPSIETRVDGRLGAPLEAVRLGGQIRFDFRYLGEMSLFALEVLRGLAPQASGAYRDAFFAMVNGADVDPKAIPDGAREVIITNDKPYARKMQVGAKGFHLYAGPFDRAAKAVRGRYGNITTADVRFVKLAGGYVLRRKRREGDQISYPALAITIRG